LLFKRGNNTSEKKLANWDFSSERNGLISLHPSSFRDLSKQINHGYQGIIHQPQLSVFTFLGFLP